MLYNKLDMKKYNTVLFDLDGTISNTSMGIIKCLKRTFIHFGINPDDYDLYKFIGPPLIWTFNHVLGEGAKQFEALEYFRSLYSKHIYENTLYEGIDDLLLSLKLANYALGVATSKYQPMALKVLKRLDVLRYFDFVYGALADRGEKDEIILAVFADSKAKKEDTILIGDTFYDMRGAQKVGIDCIGVTYGFGKREDFAQYSPVAICDNTKQLKAFFEV